MSGRDGVIYDWLACITSSGLPPTTRHVLVTIASHFNAHGESCFPTIEQLAWETGLSKRSVITHVEAAIGKGWLKRRTSKMRGQRWRNSEYRASKPDGAVPVRWKDSERYRELHPNAQADEFDSPAAPPEAGAGGSPASDDEAGATDAQGGATDAQGGASLAQAGAGAAPQVSIQLPIQGSKEEKHDDDARESAPVSRVGLGLYSDHLVEHHRWNDIQLLNERGRVAQNEAWAEDGVTLAELDSAVSKAARSLAKKGDTRQPPLAYLAAIIASDRRQGAAAVRSGPAPETRQERVERMAREAQSEFGTPGAVNDSFAALEHVS